MKKIPVLFAVIVVIVAIAGCVSFSKAKRKPDNFGFCPTYSYEGYYVTAEGEKQEITMSMMILLDSTMLGSYYNNEKNSVVYKLGGHLNEDLSFNIGEKVDEKWLFEWTGKRSADGKLLQGKRKDLSTGKEYDFSLSVAFGKSYWDYIRKNRGYEEYTNLKKAVKHKHDVLCIDVANQGLTKLPANLSSLDRIESINLLGNRFEAFPSVLAELTTLDEISLSSNGMKYIGPEIGKLKNLRILIINKNNLKTLPKEIGELTNLLYLDVGENPLNELPEEIKNLTNLQELYIDNWQPSSERFSEEQIRQIQEWLPNCKIHFDKNK